MELSGGIGWREAREVLLAVEAEGAEQKAISADEGRWMDGSINSGSDSKVTVMVTATELYPARPDEILAGKCQRDYPGFAAIG